MNPDGKVTQQVDVLEKELKKQRQVPKAKAQPKRKPHVVTKAKSKSPAQKSSSKSPTLK